MTQERDFIVDRLARLGLPSAPVGLLPPGGKPGQIPAKLDFTDYFVEWIDPPSSGVTLELDGGDSSGNDASITIDAGGA
jgi:hypothetical protein